MPASKHVDEALGVTVTAPAELAARHQWVAWRIEQRDDKPTKVPYNVRTGARASSTDPATWGRFEEAAAFCTRERFDGVGYVLSPDDPYVGIDLDACRDPRSGRIEPWAKAIISRLNSYTEISPSGTGVRIFVRGALPAHGRRKGSKEKPPAIEVYSQARFLTITGQHYMAAPDTIQDRAQELLAWHVEVFGAPPEPRQNGHVARAPVQLADADLLLKARAADNGARFWALWNGDYSAYGSQSEADLALVNHLAFWTGPDGARLDQLFRSSGLMREKWERQGYRDATIEKALAGRTEFYSGPGSNGRLTIGGHTVDPETGEVVVPARRFQFITADELKHRPPPRFVVEDIFQENTLALIVGAQESYKSFIGLDIAMSASCGIDWQGHPTTPVTVAYISAEGGSGIGLRIRAWESVHGMVEQCFFLADQAPQFLSRGNGGDVEELLLALQELPVTPGLIFVDTLARAMVGGDENSAQDMGLFVASAEQIRQATGATVVLVHHNNKQGSARGSTALTGAVHTIIECSREKESKVVLVQCGKQKDADHFETMALTATVVDLEGEQSSLVLALHRSRFLGNNGATISRATMDALNALAQLPSATFAEWRDTARLAKTTFIDARATLIKLGFVEHIANRYHLTPAGHQARVGGSEMVRTDPVDGGSVLGATYGGGPTDPMTDPPSTSDRVGEDLPWN